MNIMKILSIGNSFSIDAQNYLHAIAHQDKEEISAANLYIGDCTLEIHYRNMLSQRAAYEYWFNGHNTLLKVSLDDVLLSSNWDVVTLQQGSLRSPDYETYQPYLGALAEYVRKCVPKAKIVIHQTWAYDKEAPALSKLNFATPKEMFTKVEATYANAAKDINADFILPSGKLLDVLADAGFEKLHRDGYHASYGVGRYAIALLWYAILCKKDVTNNTFNDFDEEITPEQVITIKNCVKKICESL